MTSDALKPEELRVLQTVRDDARISIRGLASRVGLPETTARDILHRLERNGIVHHYRAVIDPEALGAGARAWIVLRVPKERHDDAVRALRDDPGVERACLLPERPDAMALWVTASSGNALALKLSRWSIRLGVRVEEAHPLCGLDEPLRTDLRAEDPEARFAILKQPAPA